MDVKRIETAFSDARGNIRDILVGKEIDAITLIESRKGAVRGNHYHEHSEQFLYVLTGRVRSYAAWPDSDVRVSDLEAGDLLHTPPLERHAIKALDDATFLV